MKLILTETQLKNTLESYLNNFVSTDNDLNWVKNIEIKKSSDSPLDKNLPYIQYFFYVRPKVKPTYDSQLKIYKKIDNLHKLMYPNKVEQMFEIPTAFFSIYMVLPDGTINNLPNNYYS